MATMARTPGSFSAALAFLADVLRGFLHLGVERRLGSRLHTLHDFAVVDGLSVGTDGYLNLYNMSVTRFSGDGIQLANDYAAIVNSWIGVAPDGSAAGNTGWGVNVTSAEVRVGDDWQDGGSGNVISDNDQGGVRFAGAAVLNGYVAGGNRIGTNVAGTAAVGNTLSGISVQDTAGVLIGGNTAGARNVISGNGQVGIEFTGSATTSGWVRGNTIGTNVISGNTTANVLVSGEATDGIQIINNLLGLNATATGTIAGSSMNIEIAGGPDNTVIGGTATGTGNQIGGAAGRGILIDSAARTG